MKTKLIQRVLTVIGTTCALSLPAGIHYVDVNSTNAVAPYTNWATAANVIQDAIDVALPGDEVVVTNGVYETGGRIDHSSRVAVIKPLSIRSVNGPDCTVIRGSRESSSKFDHVRCAYLTNGASLVGFTLTNGGAWHSGGGVYGGVLSNCMVVGNVAGVGGGGAALCTLNNCEVRQNSAGVYGGGFYSGTLNNCSLVENSAGSSGGGVADASLNNCLVISNSSHVGGGVAFHVRYGYDGSLASFPNYEDFELRNCTITGNSAGLQGGGCAGAAKLNNCIVYNNNAPQGANHAGFLGGFGGHMFYSCTTPLPTNGVGNITNAPLFVDAASGNFRLQPNSPCINAGRNTDAPTGLDLDGNPRTAGVTVDMGAYELVFTPAMLVGNLIMEVEAADLGAKNKQPLLATLNAAIASLDRGNPVAAINQLLAFQNKVRAQVSPLDSTLAASLIQTAQEIIDTLTGGATNLGKRPHGRFTKADRNAEGTVRLQFEAAPGALHLIEASTNLVDWELIGAGLPQTNGVFQFEDSRTSMFPQRFYRVRSP